MMSFRNSLSNEFLNRFNVKLKSFRFDVIQKELDMTYGIYLPIVGIGRIVSIPNKEKGLRT